MTGHPVSYRRLLEVADLPAVLMATCLSRLASRMFTLAIVLYALARFQSPILAGWLSFAAVAPALAVSPLAGALLDRVGAARAIAMDTAASATCLIALVLVDRLGVATASVLLVLVTLFSLSSPLREAGIRTLLPRLVPADSLDRVNALDTASYAAVDVLGPALAGALMGFVGPQPTMAGIALAYAAAAACLLGIRRTRHEPVASPASLLFQAWEGVLSVVRQPTLRGLAVSYSLYQLTWGVLVVVVPVFATRTFAAGGGALSAGLLWAIAGIAGGLGALAAGHFRVMGRERRAMALGMLATGFAAWPIAASFGLGGLVAGLVVVGAMSGPIDVALLTLRQRRTDPARLGRVISVSISLNIVGFPLGSALAGVLVTWSLPGACAVAAVASVLAATAAVRLIPAADDTVPTSAHAGARPAG
jgi:MFS family permease